MTAPIATLTAEGLLPCPFCGADAEKLSSVFHTLIRCASDQCISRSDAGGYNASVHERAAIVAWNTRAPDARLAEAEELAHYWQTMHKALLGDAWLPMETVPNSDLIVMFYVPDRTPPYIGRADDWHYGRENGGPGFAHWLHNATHWQPLPAPPTDPTTAAREGREG